jgi:hypothetical protein
MTNIFDSWWCPILLFKLTHYLFEIRVCLGVSCFYLLTLSTLSQRELCVPKELDRQISFVKPDLGEWAGTQAAKYANIDLGGVLANRKVGQEQTTDPGREVNIKVVCATLPIFHASLERPRKGLCWKMGHVHSSPYPIPNDFLFSLDHRAVCWAAGRNGSIGMKFKVHLGSKVGLAGMANFCSLYFYQRHLSNDRVWKSYFKKKTFFCGGTREVLNAHRVIFPVLSMLSNKTFSSDVKWSMTHYPTW